MNQQTETDPVNTFDQFETPEARQARWEAAALAAGREVDRNALRAYMAVADAEQKVLADDWARSVASTDAEVRRQRAYEQRLREQHDHDVAELNRLRARVRELERPAVEAQRNEIRQSFTEVAAQCEQDRDYEAAANFQLRLREREEQWAREDAVDKPAAPIGPDTLPAWLRQRFTATTVRWEDADADDRSYWEHQARAVRRAVARGGFKAATPAPAVSGGEQ